MTANTFQQQVNSQLSPGIEGGFAGANPYFSLITPGEAMWISGSPAPYVAKFGWADPSTGLVTSQNPGKAAANLRVGFVHRDQPVVANGGTMFSGFATQIVQGQGMDLAEDGTFWARFAAGANYGQKVYASYADGSVSAAATGTPSTTTTTIATNSTTAISYTGTAPVPGQPISGSGIPAGAVVASVNAAAGTAVISAAATATATGVTATLTTNYETAFSVRSTAAAGELAKISVRG